MEETFSLTPEERDQMLFGLYVQLTRVYDLIAVLAREVDEELVDKIIESHSEGIVFTPSPALRAENG